MPHIKSIRLANVYFNNATQFYDDFTMKLEGKNTTYDLENGGGKSLLLMMLLQTVLPKSYLRKEKPVSLLFQGGKDRTVHSVAEWILEEGSSYKYMMTGFCARKRRNSGESATRESSAREAATRETAVREASNEDENLRSGDIEHLNWCIFYNDNRVTGIRSVPLASGDAGKKSYAGFDDVRRYIQQMNQKGLPAQVFDRIDEYQGFIAGHNLIPAEWNIIRGINSGENSIEAYFRQNTTSRKLIENLFVKIIEDVEYLNKGDKNSDESLLLADTLIELRERLNEYLKLRSHMNEYEKIKEYYGEFSKRNEELSAVYFRYDENRGRAAGIKLLIDRKLKQLETAKAETQKRLEFNRDGVNEGNVMKKLLEAGLIDYRRRRLTEKKLVLEVEHNQLAEIQDELIRRLNLLYTLEAYGEYRGDKQRQVQLMKRLENLQTDADTLQAEYRDTGGKYRYRTDRLTQENEELLKVAEDGKTALEADSVKLMSSRIAVEKTESLLNQGVNELEGKENTLSERLKELQAFFMEKGEMDAVLVPDQFLGKLHSEEERFTVEYSEICERRQKLVELRHGAELERVRLDGEIQKNVELQLPFRSWMEEYGRRQILFTQRADAFGSKTVEEYAEELGLVLHKENLGKLEKEIEIARLRQKKHLSEDKGYYVPSEEILSVAGLLSAKCEYVRTGIDWIAALEQEQRKTLMQSMPFLSYSVIIDGVSFDKLRGNKMKMEFSSDYPVPIVNLELLRHVQSSAGSVVQDDNIYYFCNFSALLTDEEQFRHYIKNMETLIENLMSEADISEIRIDELTSRRMEAAAFLELYTAEKVKEHTNRLQELEQAASALTQQKLRQQKEYSRREAEEAVLGRKSAELAELIEHSKEKQDKLIESMETAKTLAEHRNLLKKKRTELEAARMEIRTLMDALAKNNQQQKLASNEIDGLRKKQYEMTALQEQLKGFAAIENDLLLLQLAAAFNALDEAVSGRMAEESSLCDSLRDVEKRLENQRTRTLRNYGEDLEQIEGKETAGQPVILPARETIVAAMNEQKEIRERLTKASEKLKEMELKEQGEAGKLEEILRGMPEDSASRLPQFEEEAQYKQELEYYRQLIRSYEDGMAAITEEIGRTSDEIIRYARQSEDFGAFLERERIPDNMYGNEPGAELQIEDYRAFYKNYYSLQDEISGQFNKWEDRMKAIQTEAAGFVIREPLVELGKISHPESAVQCRNRTEAFREYLLNIEEQMRKIGYDIEQLENYQQSFTQRCVQRAELILGHLKKLESLSRIEIYGGRRINMIELKLVEFEQNEKLLRMKNHINGIVREIGEEGTVDRKRIAALLSTKELLAQIIDMDKAAVRLYKVESIPENSRYYRWEYAIGSEGQNNSLYFIFAACLISFIRMLSITNTSAHTKKVIIADNPFGATSAVYLWDPMFKIMKQNDIQLIAPGHRIPREITSRFGVSYLLNQDILQDGRIRVVVKDVRAEEDEEVITWMDPEQLSLF